MNAEPVQKPIEANVQKEVNAFKLTPNNAIDRVSTVALFALYSKLPPGTKFGISGHVLTRHKKYSFPLIGGYIQGGIRKFSGDSCEEASDFSLAIIDAITWYGKDPNFIKILELAQAGIGTYARNYLNEKTEKNAVAALLLAQSKIGDFLKVPKNDEQKEEQNLPELQDNIRKSWLPEDIEKLSRDILLIFNKKLFFDAELESTLLYLDLKQRDIAPLLAKEQTSYLKRF